MKGCESFRRCGLSSGSGSGRVGSLSVCSLPPVYRFNVTKHFIHRLPQLACHNGPYSLKLEAKVDVFFFPIQLFLVRYLVTSTRKATRHTKNEVLSIKYFFLSFFANTTSWSAQERTVGSSRRGWGLGSVAEHGTNMCEVQGSPK